MRCYDIKLIRNINKFKNDKISDIIDTLKNNILFAYDISDSQYSITSDLTNNTICVQSDNLTILQDIDNMRVRGIIMSLLRYRNLKSLQYLTIKYPYIIKIKKNETNENYNIIEKEISRQLVGYKFEDDNISDDGSYIYIGLLTYPKKNIYTSQQIPFELYYNNRVLYKAPPKHTEFINYAISAHGSRISDHDYIVLPPGIRVIMMCTDSTCPTSFVVDKLLWELMMNEDLHPNLDNLNPQLFTRNYNKYNMCVFSGNIDDRFTDTLNTAFICEAKSANIVPNLSFSAEHGRFRDGIFKMPVKPVLKSTNGDTIDTNMIKYSLGKLTYKNKQTNYAGALLIPGISKNFNANLIFESEYITFHKNYEPNVKSSAELNINTLRDLIDFIKTKENFDSKNCMITIFTSTCVGTTRDYIQNPRLCMIEPYVYSTLVTSFIQNHTLYQGLTLADYDITTANGYIAQKGGYLSNKQKHTYKQKYSKYKKKYFLLKKMQNNL